jgi:protein-tyrosine phosphatase
MFRILIVCTANICRSPAAQAFLARALQKEPVEVRSAGIHARNFEPADAMIRDLMLKRGYPELAGHRSRMLMPSHYSEHDLLLVMEKMQIDYMGKANPFALGKAKLMSHWAGRGDVADPVGQSRGQYEKVLDELETLSGQWAQKIIDLRLSA